MAVNLGSAYGEIRIDGSGAMGTIGRVQRGLLGLGGGFGTAATAALGFGTALTAGVAIPLVGAGARAVHRTSDVAFGPIVGLTQDYSGPC